VTLAAVAASDSTAPAADVLKVAVGQCGNWDSSPVQLGDGAGIYAKHGIAIEAVCTQGTGETQQAVISGSADIGTDATTIAYSTNGSSTHAVVLGLIRELGLKGKPVATGGPAATLTVALSGQVDIGWTSPPLGFDMLDDGRIRIFARANDVPSLKGQTIRVNTANANALKERRDVFVRFMKAFGETIEWMYSSDPKALEAYVAFRKTTPRNAARLRDEFFPKSALDPNTVKGMDGLMTEAVNLKYMSRVPTPAELAEFVQVPLK
jgi:NitT/TauT family transport system substrate-binding protein